MSIDIVLINDLILDGYNDVESIHLANIIKCQRKIYKEASIRRQLFKEERAVIIKKNKEDIRNNPDGWYQYNKKVRGLTEKNKHKIEGIENRGFKKMHIDHIVSVWYGYCNKINPELIASIPNLRMLHYRDNMKKGTKLTKEAKKVLNPLGIQ